MVPFPKYMSEEVKLKPISSIYKTGLQYVEMRKTGQAVSMRTPWKQINKAGVNGFEWNTIITIAGRPGSGKTTFMNQFTRAAHRMNPGLDFHVIDFQFEMPDRQTALREFAAHTGKKYNQLLSAYRQIGDDTIQDIQQYIESNKTKPIFIVDTPVTIREMRSIIINHITEHRVPLIVTIDHSLLIKLDKGERDKYEMLYNLGEMMTELKKKYPVIFLVLTQMNRSIEDASRKVNGSVANYPTGADIFGADALVQHSDMVLVINRPAAASLKEYGPLKYQVTKDLVACHFVKVRNGENMLAFFKFHGGEARFEEIEAPPNIGPPRENVIDDGEDEDKTLMPKPLTGFQKLSTSSF